MAELQNKHIEKGFCGNHTKDFLQHITLGTFPVDKEGELEEVL